MKTVLWLVNRHQAAIRRRGDCAKMNQRNKQPIRDSERRDRRHVSLLMKLHRHHLAGRLEVEVLKQGRERFVKRVYHKIPSLAMGLESGAPVSENRKCISTCRLH